MSPFLRVPVAPELKKIYACGVLAWLIQMQSLKIAVLPVSWLPEDKTTRNLIIDERSEYSTGEKKQFLYGLLLSTAVT